MQRRCLRLVDFASGDDLAPKILAFTDTYNRLHAPPPTDGRTPARRSPPDVGHELTPAAQRQLGRLADHVVGLHDPVLGLLLVDGLAIESSSIERGTDLDREPVA